MPPKDDSVDPRAVDLVNEYKELARIAGIEFDSTIGVGFIRIEEPRVIGLCHYGLGYRQIQIDAPFWESTDQNTRLALLFHELTHCYCTRSHDHSTGKYPETPKERDEEWEYMTHHQGQRPGYFGDGCPNSLMAPIVVEDTCVQLHYAHYIVEMFENCSPY